MKIDAVTCSRVHSGLWAIRIIMRLRCWSFSSHVTEHWHLIGAILNNFGRVYWTGKSQYLGQIRDHLIGVGEKWIYIIGAWLMWQTWPGPGWDHKGNWSYFTFLQTSRNVAGEGRRFLESIVYHEKYSSTLH